MEASYFALAWRFPEISRGHLEWREGLCRRRLVLFPPARWDFVPKCIDSNRSNGGGSGGGAAVSVAASLLLTLPLAKVRLLRHKYEEKQEKEEERKSENEVPA